MPGASVVAHLAVVGIWGICAAVVAGTGFLVLRCITGPGESRASIFAAAWAGLAGIVLWLQTWHFFFRVDGRPLIAILVAAAAGLGMRWVAHAQALRATAAPEPAREALRRSLRPGVPGLLAAGVFLATALWLANRSLGSFLAYDSAMYLLPGTEWAKALPLVPGLGALHGRLGFNSSSVLLAAVLESGPWPAAAPHLLNGFFLFMVTARAADGLRRMSGSASGERARAVFDVLLLAPVVAMAIDDQLVPGLSADVAVAAALFGGASLLVEAAITPRDAGAWAPLTAAMLAFTVAVTFKLSAAVFAAVGCAAALSELLRRSSPPGRRRAGVIALSLSVALGSSWITRGVITTGYPLYPATVGAMPVDWRVPPAQAQAEAAWVAHFARNWYDLERANAPVPASQPWLAPWLRANATGRDAAFVLLPLLCATLAGAALLVVRDGQALWPVTRAALPALLSLAFWLFTAPRPSLAIGPAWVLGAALSAAFLARPRGSQRASPALALASVLTLIVAANGVRMSGQLTAPDDWRNALLTWPDPRDWFREGPRPDVEPFLTRSGLVLNVPVRGNLCARAPLPCTPHPAPNLRLRSPGEMRKGFTIDGDWQPSRWPNPASQFLESWRASRAGSR